MTHFCLLPSRLVFKRTLVKLLLTQANVDPNHLKHYRDLLVYFFMSVFCAFFVSFIVVRILSWMNYAMCLLSRFCPSNCIARLHHLWLWLRCVTSSPAVMIALRDFITCGCDCVAWLHHLWLWLLCATSLPVCVWWWPQCMTFLCLRLWLYYLIFLYSRLLFSWHFIEIVNAVVLRHL